MCGIVGYTGVRSALDVVLAQLAGLGPPGEPAAGGWGVAVLADGGGLGTCVADGPLAALDEALRLRPLPSGGCGLGLAGRPQLDEAGRVAVALAGEVVNLPALTAELTARGHAMRGGDPGEAGAHLFAEAFSSAADPAEAMRQVCRALRGDFALLALHADAPDTLVAARRGLPLTVGLGVGEALVASDEAAFAAQPTGEVLRLDGTPGEQVVLLRREWDEVGCEITDAEGGVLRA
ncbi:glucosamine--fructose-6-phosphate aminotransferase [Streptomyces profundus]|uniref:glucosamine--fructose-6-phosphate aminotransferase n=1 Tax=Streptomyces profundus TaxID=2867410 RepID=UPI001D1637BE|nr:glucosamine--fructose-6-phosphate aminotransferase [Streptomyces sp. MA3_2.13]UED84600.1 glucosamine--fructose-6-phosphate aminotransferase [Streptomyces sp. MA3_2.13]